MTCDQMATVLGQINFRKGKNLQVLSPSELPGLQELIESI
jgi:hypothetical protein